MVKYLGSPENHYACLCTRSGMVYDITPGSLIRYEPLKFTRKPKPGSGLSIGVADSEYLLIMKGPNGTFDPIGVVRRDEVDVEKSEVRPYSLSGSTEITLTDLVDIAGRKHTGHPRFYELLEEISGLHDRKNSDYAKGGRPLGNFERRADFYARFPGLNLGSPVVVAMIDAMKQLDAAFWLLCQGHAAECEGVQDRLRDVSVYSLLAMILHEEEVSRGRGEEATEDGSPQESEETSTASYVWGKGRTGPLR